MDAQLKISRSITRLLLQHPFWAAIALGTEFQRDDDVGTMATNGKKIWWSEKFVNEQSEPKVLGTIAHELCHIVLKHMLRRGNRDMKKWNIATDFAINDILLKEGFELPDGVLNDPQYHHMMAERIYEMVPDHITPQPWGMVADDDLTEDQKQEMEVEIDQRIMNAANAAKSIGKMPAFMEGVIAEMEAAQISWQDKVRRFLIGDQPDDYTFRKPERKAYHHLGLIAPSVDHRGAGNWVIGIDTSASVGDDELKHFLGELNVISTEVKPQSITVIYCDTKVNHVDVFDNGDEIVQMNYKSRGGTCVMPVFDYIEEERLPVDQMIYMTDLEVSDFPEGVPYPLLWVSTAPPSERAPVGDTVTITIRK